MIASMLIMYLSYSRATRNPHDPSRISGGSSSGSAAVVASGLCPVALGVDGGGILFVPQKKCMF